MRGRFVPTKTMREKARSVKIKNELPRGLKKDLFKYYKFDVLKKDEHTKGF